MGQLESGKASQDWIDARDLLHKYVQKHWAQDNPSYSLVLGPHLGVNAVPADTPHGRLHGFAKWVADAAVERFSNPKQQVPFSVQFQAKDLTLAPASRGHFPDQRFVSWLYFIPGKLTSVGQHTMMIRYDKNKVGAHVAFRNQSHYAATPAEKMRTRLLLTKIYLHEIAHIWKHLSTQVPGAFDPARSPSESVANITATDEEGEAWFYALLWWALILDDYACVQRGQNNGDPTWQIA